MTTSASAMTADQLVPRPRETDAPSVPASAPRPRLPPASITWVGWSIGATTWAAVREAPSWASKRASSSAGSRPIEVAMLLRWPRA